MKKRILSVVLVLMLMLSLLPAFSLQAEAASIDQAKAVVEVALGYASSGKSIGVMCAGMVSKAANEAGVGTSQIPKATIASPFVGRNQFGFIDSSGNLKYGCKAYTWKDFANGSYTPQTGDLVFYGYMKSGGGTASKTITQVAKSGDYYHTHVGIIRNDDSTMSKLYTVDGGQNSSSDTSHYTYVKTKDRKISDTNTGYAWTSNSKKIYVMEFVRPNYKKEAEVTVNKTVECPARITIKAAAPLYRSATTNTVTDSEWDKYNDETSVTAIGYVDLSNSQRRYYFVAPNGKTGEYLTYYVPTSSLINIEAIHNYGAADLEHPHYKTCVCGDKQPVADKYCYECYPSYICYVPCIPGDYSATVQNITTGRYPDTVIMRTAWDWKREGYTLVGWALEKNAVTPTYLNIEEEITILPGNTIDLYAVWQEKTHAHTMEHHTRQDATCLNTGNIEYWFCTDCGMYYLDADATIETTAEAVILPALGHNYVNGTCTRCSAKDPNAAEPDPNAAVVSVAPVRGKAGQTIEVAVTLENNPGFADLSIEIGYDTDIMQLTSVTHNSAVGGNFTTSQQLDQQPYMLNWVEGTKSNTFTGTLVTLLFQIKDSAAPGSYPVTVSYYKGKQGNNVDGEDVNYDQDFNRVPITYVDGSVTVYSYTPGDLNGDDKINTKDVVYLLRYIAGWSLDGLEEDALDVNGDGKVNSKDAVHLLRYIAGWDVTLH